MGLEGLKSIQREEIKIDEKVDQEIPFSVAFFTSSRHEKNIFAQILALCTYFGLSHNDTETAQQKLPVKLVENVITIICFCQNISIP